MATAVLWFVVAFVGMEGVAYASHRWLMHGVALAWHRSHHAPPKGRLERNDLFPLVGAATGILLFAGASAGWTALWPVAIGVTAYGATYLFVHDVHIHGRLPVRLPDLRYLRWVRDAHAVHHRTSGEPYGMLLPVLRRPARPAAQADRDRLARAASTRESRARL